MKHCVMLRREFSIIGLDDRVIFIYIFFYVPSSILNVAIVYFRCCDGASDEKFPIGRSSSIPEYNLGRREYPSMNS